MNNLKVSTRMLLLIGALSTAVRRRRSGPVWHIFGAISAASADQSAGVAQVGQAIGPMDQATQQNVALVEQIAAAESLKQQAQQLVQAVAVFQLGHATHG